MTVALAVTAEKRCMPAPKSRYLQTAVSSSRMRNGEGSGTMKEEKRRGIMRAAESLLSEGRFHETTMDDVARKAGVGKGTLYRYFRDKEDLLHEVATAGFDELCDMVRSEGKRTADFRTCLLNVCQRVSAFLRRRLMHIIQTEERRIMWKPGKAREEWLVRRRQLIDAVTTILSVGRKHGDIRKDYPLRTLAVFLLGMLRTRGREERFNDRFDADHATVVDLFLNGTAPRKSDRLPATPVAPGSGHGDGNCDA